MIAPAGPRVAHRIASSRPTPVALRRVQVRIAQRQGPQRGNRHGRAGDQVIGAARRRRHLFGDIGQPTDDVIDRHEVEARARAGGQDMDSARRHQAEFRLAR
jgi:hypothetical protein